MKLYYKQNIADLIVKNQKSKLLQMLVKNGLDLFIDNCNAQIAILEYENNYLPLVIAGNDKNQTYLTSLISSYIGYPKYILKNSIVNILFSFLNKILNWSSIDKVVYVNHWLLSTNIHYDLLTEQINEITKFIKQNFPDYAICFRNVAKETNETLFSSLLNNKYKFIINRCSYYIDNKYFEKVYKKQSLKKDLSLYRKKNYQISDKIVDIVMQEQLYNDSFQ